MQKQRGQSVLNGKLSEGEVEKFIILDKEAQDVLTQAISRFGLSARGVANVKKVARTIADLAQKEQVTKEDILESLGYRRR